MLSLALQPSASPLGPKQDQNVVQVFLQSGLSYCLGSDNTHLSLFVKLANMKEYQNGEVKGLLETLSVPHNPPNRYKKDFSF